jgi:hypothetical protein
MHKICTRCKQNKSISEFRARQDRQHQYHSWCKKCTTESIKLSRQKLKQVAIAYKGGACKNCGYSKCIGALHFHHRDPKQKDFTIAVASHNSTLTLEDIKQELDKCILVCANCHGELHSGVITYHDNSSSFIHTNGV